MLTLSQFTYHLPVELIAQTPAQPRDSSRLLVLDSLTGEMSHHHFSDLPRFLSQNDVIVRNNTKVIPARLLGVKKTGGRCELLLIKCLDRTAHSERWECLTRPGVKLGQTIELKDTQGQTLMTATCSQQDGYVREMEFSLGGPAFLQTIDTVGKTPIPPDIHWTDGDELRLRELYQTTYAKIKGSAAAPTAGLHFTPELDEKLRAQGVEILEVTLHVGLGTFANLSEDELESQQLHSECYELTAEVADKINQAKAAGKRIIAVGTTSCRVLETCAMSSISNTGVESGKQLLKAQSGETTLMISPPFSFQIVDALITNFHYPGSSLLTLVSALTTTPNTPHCFVDFGHTTVGTAYLEAIDRKYRFYSFGDSMLIQRGKSY